MQKDIRLEQVLAVAEKCLRHGLEVDFPFIVGFPNESDESVQATLDLVMRLRAMSPRFHTPIFYFRPYPGSPITQAAVAAGFQLPRTLQEWSTFDMYAGGGPWVSPERYRHIERFKYYQEIAWSKPKMWKRPLQALARWRCRHDRYELPADKLLRDALIRRRLAPSPSSARVVSRARARRAQGPHGPPLSVMGRNAMCRPPGAHSTGIRTRRGGLP